MDPAERPTAILPGATLAGVTLRKAFWGGEELDLLRSINQCRYFFMAANEPWLASDPSAVDLYAYLQSLEPLAHGALREQVPFTVVREVRDVPAQPTGGDQIYDRACRNCHGAPHTAQGRPRPSTPLLPEDAITSHEYLKSRDATRLVFIEKVRHGGFLGYGGLMPPFSLEAMTDAELGALLSFLGLY
jgi:thiosulfate dehydrogenase